MSNLQLMGGMVEGGYQEVDTSLCKSFLDALGVCIQVSRVKRTDANLAVSAGIHPAQFSRIRQGKAHMPTDKINVIEKLCGNTAITQYLAIDGRYFAECLCDCGNQKTILKGNLTGGHTVSCGCVYEKTRKVDRFKPMYGHKKLSEAKKKVIKDCYMSGHLPKWMYS